MLDLTETANYLKISTRALRDICKRRGLTHIRLDRLNWRFRVADVEGYHCRRPIAEKGVYA